MPVDTRGLRPEHVGRRLRIELTSGEIDEVDLLELTICDEPQPCCGVTYRLVSTDLRDGTKEEGGVYWTGFGDIENFQVLGA
jgi:hypothetical protein